MRANRHDSSPSSNTPVHWFDTLETPARLWYMNADFEAELAALPLPYRRTPTIARRNAKLAPSLLWLARSGDALLIDEPWRDALREEARKTGVELLAPARASDQGFRIFTPWGWTPGAVSVGVHAGARVAPQSIEVIARVNSKLFSHGLEHELGVAVPGARIASTRVEVDDALAAAFPRPQDKWVVKSPLGFAARGRVLGRGPKLDPASAVWVERRLRTGESLLVEPWHVVVREYGVPMWIGEDGRVEIVGISDLVTNGAGAAIGYMLGRPVDPGIRAELERIAHLVGRRLRAEGYSGPAGIDALEVAGGLRPLLEINARYTMGFVAVEVERRLAPREATFWSAW